MDEHQHELRLAAEKAFMDSLNKLQETLKLSDREKTEAPAQAEAVKSSRERDPELAGFDLSALEDAAADIEQFMASWHPESTSSEE